MLSVRNENQSLDVQLSFNPKFEKLVLYQLIATLVKDIAIGTGGLGFDLFSATWPSGDKSHMTSSIFGWS